MTPRRVITTTRRSTRGFTLVEIAMSLLVLGIVATAAGGLLVLAARIWPGRAIDRGGRTLSAALGQMAEDLAQATSVEGVAGNWIRFTVPDRDGDSAPESIVYSWSGVAGEPLMRQLSGYSPAAITGPLDRFQLSVGTCVETSASTGSVTTTGSVTLVDASASGEVPISSSSAVGLVFAPSLPADAVSWGIDSVRLRLRSSSTNNDFFRIRVHTVSGLGLPNGAILADVVVPESTLSASMTWQDFPVSVTGLPPGTSVAVCILHASGVGESCRVTASLISGLLTGVVRSVTGGSTWLTVPTASLGIRVTGRVTTPASAPPARISQIRATASASGQAGRTVTHAAVIPNRPAQP